MRTALLFPGQASQRPGMGAPWVGTPGWSLAQRAGVTELLLTATAEELRPTAAAQLSTFVTSLVALASLPPLDVTVVAGHSLGELTALVAAGVLSSDAGLALVAARGAAMAAACEAQPGTMAAVLGLPDEAFDELGTGAWPANFNAPAHVVVSGTVDGVAAAGIALREAGARRVLPLPVGGAFHTPLMAPARERLEAALAEATYAPGRVPVLRGETATAYGTDVATALSSQLTAPVRWRALMESLDVERVVEVGPGGVLTGLAKRCRPDLVAVSVSSPTDLESL